MPERDRLELRRLQCGCLDAKKAPGGSHLHISVADAQGRVFYNHALDFFVDEGESPSNAILLS